jgi:hypothetical protein
VIRRSVDSVSAPIVKSDAERACCRPGQTRLCTSRLADRQSVHRRPAPPRPTRFATLSRQAQSRPDSGQTRRPSPGPNAGRCSNSRTPRTAVPWADRQPQHDRFDRAQQPPHKPTQGGHHDDKSPATRNRAHTSSRPGRSCPATDESFPLFARSESRRKTHEIHSERHDSPASNTSQPEIQSRLLFRLRISERGAMPIIRRQPGSGQRSAVPLKNRDV